VRRQEHVGGFHVPVHEPRAVEHRERARQVSHDPTRVMSREWRDRVEGDRIDTLEHDAERAVSVVNADALAVNELRRPQRRKHRGLAARPLERPAGRGVHGLQDDEVPIRTVARLPHLTLTASSELPKELVALERLPRSVPHASMVAGLTDGTDRDRARVIRAGSRSADDPSNAAIPLKMGVLRAQGAWLAACDVTSTDHQPTRSKETLMNIQKRTLAAVLSVLTLASPKAEASGAHPACAHHCPASVPRLPSIGASEVQTALNELLRAEGLGATRAATVLVDNRELDDDERTVEALVTVVSKEHCSPAGCATLVVRRAGSGLVALGSGRVLTVLKSRSKGWLDLTDSTILPLEPARALKFDGARYR
jgi:hypothetical protein